jgi:hypothetical protein
MAVLKTADKMSRNFLTGAFKLEMPHNAAVRRIKAYGLASMRGLARRNEPPLNPANTYAYSRGLSGRTRKRRVAAQQAAAQNAGSDKPSRQSGHATHNAGRDNTHSL